MPPNVVENNRAKVLWDLDFLTDKQLLANHLDTVVVDKEVEIDMEIPVDGDIRKKAHEKISK